MTWITKSTLSLSSHNVYHSLVLSRSNRPRRSVCFADYPTVPGTLHYRYTFCLVRYGTDRRRAYRKRCSVPRPLSFMSAITLLGTPAEVYQYGTQYVVIGFSYLLVMPAAAYLYMPVFFDLQVISVYEVSSYNSSLQV